MDNREKILEQLKKMTPEERAKPIIMRMGEEPNHNIVTGDDVLRTLSGDKLSYGSPTPNQGGIVSKDKLLDRLNKIIK